MKWWQILVYPFSLLYAAVIRFRNHLFNIGSKRTASFEPIIISVGNLAVGGTGKTPCIEYLVRLLSPHYQLAVLSRGYGRNTRGVRLAAEDDSAQTLGDEPYQYWLKWGVQVPVAVAEQRVWAIPEIMDRHPQVDVILLDDAFQHRYVERDLNVLLTTFQRPFYNDWVMPSGRLREPRRSAARADAVLVTKCPEKLSLEQQQNFRQSIQRYTSVNTPVFFATLAYDALEALYSDTTDDQPLPEKWIIVSGIAHPELFYDYCNEQFNVVDRYRYRDHHQFVESEVRQWITKLSSYENERVGLLTTEKDRARLLSQPELEQHLRQIQAYYLPIRQKLLQNGLKFDNFVLESLTGRHAQ